MGVGLIVKAVLFVASTAYQVVQAKKIKKKQEAEAEKRKGFGITVSGEAVPIPIIYGKNKLGGIEVIHKITSRYSASGNNASNYFSQGLANTSASGTKNEYLHVQYALCQEGIEGVVSVQVNDLNYNDAGQRFSHSIRTFNNGGTADNIATANGISSNNRFTGCAYASATFKLDRDDPQYNGLPSLGFLVKGRKIRGINSDYTLGGYAYSNNPALCLLDYLLNSSFGRGISVNDIDLESFYHAANVCNTNVSSNRSIAGLINGGATTRNIPLYECNIVLDSSDSIRNNIESIMNTMGLAELTWSSEGKYKLLLEHPTSNSQQNALVNSKHYFTDDDIIRDDISLSWPSASDRLNQATVSFVNEHEDFKSDSITWPKTFSTAHNAYLSEDNSQPFIKSISLDGVTDPYHATAMAEMMVRHSRSSVTLSFTVSKKGLSLECGDFISVTSEAANITAEVFRVQSLEVNSDFTVKLTCYNFDYRTLAWNVNDDIAYSVRPTYDFSVEPVSGLVYTPGTPEGDVNAIAELSWNAPNDGSFKSIVYYKDVHNNQVLLGETSNQSFYVHPKDAWPNNQSVEFIVKSQTPFGRLSTGVSLTASVVKAPLAPTSFTASESLYQTNKASGVKARASISFSETLSSIAVKHYKIEYYRQEDSTNYQLLDFTVSPEYVFNDIRAGNYYFRITPISYNDVEGDVLIGNKVILGLSAIPADPTGFSSRVTDTGMVFSWNTPVDLDVVSGGTSEIRYIPNTAITPKWEIAQVIIENITGSTTSATLPVAPGYYLLKHTDSSGNSCNNPAQVSNTFVGKDFNLIATLTEEPTFAGTKTNCSVVGSNLELDASQTEMTYLFNNSIDLGSVETIRLVPNLNAVITDGVTVVANYNPVADVARFAGPIVDASLAFEFRYTDDDPSGTPTWSDWETFIIGNYTHRAFEFRLLGKAASSTYTISVSELSLIADKEDVTKRGVSISSTSADTTVTFPTSFYGGIGGADIPYVGINTVGGSAGDTLNIVSITKSGYTYSVYNSGSRVARNINWQAVGQ
jgi:hypothetical protein